jgi:hypothetical protein
VEIPNKLGTIEWVDINSIHPDPLNCNKHPPDNVKTIAKILEHYGWRLPIVVRNDIPNQITAGEGRWLAAKQLKQKRIPIMREEFALDEAMCWGIADNGLSQTWGGLDFGDVNKLLEKIGPIDIELLALKDFVVEIADKYADQDADAIPENVETRCKSGDLWLLGEHRLLCGDCTDPKNISLLMNGEKADMVFTSPPYNLGKFEVSGPKATKPNRKEKYLAGGDNMSPEEYENFLSDFIEKYLAIADTVLINIGMVEGNKRAVIKMVYNHLDNFKETLYWKKSTSTPHIQPGIVTSLVEPVFCFGNHNSRQFKNSNFKGNCNNVIEGQNGGGNEFAKIHAATFPVYFPEWAIKNFSQGKIVEPFCGSGSTLIACEKTNRDCFAMELDPRYCDVILARWEKFTGKTAVKE